VNKTFNTKTVNEKVALNGLSLHLNDSDFIAVIGGNSAGKSAMPNATAKPRCWEGCFRTP